MQSLSKRCIELIASGFSDISGNREQEGLMLVSAQMCYKSIRRDCCMKGMEVVFFFFFLLRAVKTKNSHILSLPFRGLLGLAYSSALICKWAACFPAGDTGRRPRNTEEMSCQESSPAASTAPRAALRAKFVFWLKNKIPLLIVFPSNINVYIFTLLVISAGQ